MPDTKSDTEMVTITRARYESLFEDARLLAHLEVNGVDNWEGYSYPDKEEEDEDESA